MNFLKLISLKKCIILCVSLKIPYYFLEELSQKFCELSTLESWWFTDEFFNMDIILKDSINFSVSLNLSHHHRSGNISFIRKILAHEIYNFSPYNWHKN